MVFTSYYGNIGHLLKAGFKPEDLIGISQYKFNWYSVPSYCHELAPSQSLLWNLKGNIISRKEYARTFYDYLYSLDYRFFENFEENFDGKVLLCFEKNFRQCHRYLVANFVNWYLNKIIVKEFQA